MKLVRGALVMFGMAAATLALSAGPANAGGTCGYGGCGGYGGYYGSYYGGYYPYYGLGYGGYANVPVNICGNSVSLLGVSATQAACN
ncbi:hypothetical protein [Actinoplanes sp. NPDC049118]|uniref:hypothetical protein n=1 Tax=Actinoplanes sp. NPDC049118 TaxID=3155769 RepID=UPI0033E3184B